MDSNIHAIIISSILAFGLIAGIPAAFVSVLAQGEDGDMAGGMPGEEGMTGGDMAGGNMTDGTMAADVPPPGNGGGDDDGNGGGDDGNGGGDD